MNQNPIDIDNFLLDLVFVISVAKNKAYMGRKAERKALQYYLF